MKVIYKNPIQDLISEAIKQAKLDKKTIEVFELNQEEWQDLKDHLLRYGWDIPLDDKPFIMDGYLFRLEHKQ